MKIILILAIVGYGILAYRVLFNKLYLIDKIIMALVFMNICVILLNKLIKG